MPQDRNIPPRPIGDFIADIFARHGEPEQASAEEQAEARRSLAAHAGAVDALCRRRYSAVAAANLEERFGLRPGLDMAAETRQGVTTYRILPEAFRR
jgi:phage tail protein X